jgi:hypothetical protein
LGASVTRRYSFLPKPSAFGPDLTLWQLVDDRRQYLNNSSSQPAIGAVELRTTICLARCSKAEDLRRVNRSRHCKNFWRCQKRLVEVGDFRSVGRLLDDSEHTGTLHARL